MPKEFVYGNSKVIVYSPLAQMNKEEQRAFFQSEWAKGNQVLRNIVQAAHDCLTDQVSTLELEKFS